VISIFNRIRLLVPINPFLAKGYWYGNGRAWWWRCGKVWYDDLDNLKEDTSGGLIVLGIDSDLEVSAEYR
jgi:hypothetical protein